MAENPFDLKNFGLLAALGAEPRRNGLLDYITPPTPQQEVSPLVRAIAGLLMDEPTPALPVSPNPYVSGLGGLFGSLAPTAPTKPSFNALANLIAAPPPYFAPPSPARAFGSLADVVAPHKTPTRPASTYVPAPVKRKGFFSFHYADIMRVYNVRNACKINCPGREDKRQFYDRSLWESVQRNDPEGLKKLIRDGMEHASVVCVLVGTHTWSRPWVRYEIARSVIDKKGLLAVHINGLRHHQRLEPDANGENPLDYVGVGCAKRGIYHLYERIGRPVVQYGQVTWHWRWEKYSKFSAAVSVPKYIQAPVEGKVVPLSTGTAIYDYVGARGHENIGLWIDAAALRAGR